jgi:4-hydroxy-3-methylbut-2-enyl diphosphate reductase
VRQRAQEKHLFIIDATCPLVTKVHLEAIRYAKNGYSIVLIGHPGHEEVEGTMGEAPYAMHLVADVEDVQNLQLPDNDKVVYLTQTTLSVDDTREVAAALKRKYPAHLAAAQRRHLLRHDEPPVGHERIGPLCDLVLVIGAQNSSNSQRLREVAEACGTRAFLDRRRKRHPRRVAARRPNRRHQRRCFGAEVLVERVITELKRRGAREVETLQTIAEDVFFHCLKSCSVCRLSFNPTFRHSTS